MKTCKVYRVYYDGSVLCPISGETLLEAIRENLTSLVSGGRCGNAAGCELEKLVVKYDPSIFSGKGGAVLEVTAHGSDMLVRYDPREDETKTTFFYIEGVSPDELPEPDVTTFSGEGSDHEPKSTPYDDPENLSQAWGNLIALLDEVGQHHCKTESVWPSVQIADEYHNLDRNNPFRYLEVMRQKVNRAHPRTDAFTKKMLSQVDKLALLVTEHTKEENVAALIDYMISLYYAQSFVYLRAEGRITALAYYRNLAGLSGRELGEKVGISDRQIRNYENPHTSTLFSANHSVVQALADVLGVRPSQLVDDGGTVLVDSDGNEA